jgi:hypothetical protein
MPQECYEKQSFCHSSFILAAFIVARQFPAAGRLPLILMAA